ncbi:MAG: hypothetical protein J6T74_05320, partial [Clostridia bacterium]|nr:hypothetical protein [Clostridia bacterium]
MVNENLYIYAYDAEGDLVFIKKPNKYVVIGGKEEKSIVTTTDIPENAQHYFETSDARAMIEYIQNGDVVFDDETVDTEKLKLAYKDKYGNFYDRLTDKVVYINDDGDEIGESMEMEFSEAKQILNESGYQLIDEALEGPATSKQLWTLYKLTKKDYRGKDLSKEDAFKMIGELLKNKENGSAENKETLVKKAPKTAKPKINDNPLVKVGDIFSFSFGYDMTINQYYKVLSTKGKKAQVVEIGKKWVSGDPGYTGEVVPVPDREIDEPITALIKDDG